MPLGVFLCSRGCLGGNIKGCVLYTAFESQSLCTQLLSWETQYTYLCIYVATGESRSTLWGCLLAHSGAKLSVWVYLPVYIRGYWGIQEHSLRLPPCPLRCEVEGTGYTYLCIYLATGNSWSTLWGSLLANSGVKLRDCVYTGLLESPGVWIGDKHSLTCIVFLALSSFLTSFKDD